MKPALAAEAELALAKVPAVTLGFWVIKILATTFGETAGDTLSMSLNVGYLVSSLIFGLLLAVLVAAQIRAAGFHPLLYWATIIASTTAGTTLADFSTRSLGTGYPGGSVVLLASVIASLAWWQRQMGSISISSVHEPQSELHYWVTITLSQTLGTALGDWVADGSLGYLGAAALFSLALAVVCAGWWRKLITPVAAFWAAFVLTRPLGAAVGDFLDKPITHGGLELSRAGASLALGAAILALICAIPQRAAVRN